MDSCDAVGNRTRTVELEGTCVTWSYDPAYQLINECCSGLNAYNTTYQYDRTGNRLVKNDSGQRTTHSYNAANELTLVQPPTGQPTTISWDANGNCLVENQGGARTTYTWDTRNRMKRVVYPNGTVDTCTYSAKGQRRRKTTASGTNNFVWDGENVLQEADAAYTTVAQYTDFPGTWGGLASQRRSGASSFYGFDPQGNTRALGSSGGSITDRYSYKGFGEETAASGSTVNPHRFCGVAGYYRDTASRQYVRARHLDTGTGRWMSRDPAQSGGGSPTGLYEYVRNRPINAADPSGLFDVRWCYVICAFLLVSDPPLYNTCVEFCSTTNDLAAFTAKLNELNKLRGDCFHPRVDAHCWTKCPGSGKDFRLNCSLCCEALYGGAEGGYVDCNNQCEIFSGERPPPGQKKKKKKGRACTPIEEFAVAAVLGVGTEIVGGGRLFPTLSWQATSGLWRLL